MNGIGDTVRSVEHLQERILIRHPFTSGFSAILQIHEQARQTRYNYQPYSTQCECAS